MPVRLLLAVSLAFITCLTAKSQHNRASGSVPEALIDSAAREITSKKGISSQAFERVYPTLRTRVLQLASARILSFLNKQNVPLSSVDTYLNRHHYELITIVNNAMLQDPALAQYLETGQEDYIQSFTSTVRVLPSGKLLVREDITVYNSNAVINPLYSQDLSMHTVLPNNEIIHGLVRRFPIYYYNQAGLFQNTSFKLLRALRDDEPEKYHTKKEQNGVAVYFGSENTLLSEGRHRYTLEYETTHQLKFLENYDELFWNVTGNDWSFRIDTARYNLVLPGSTRPLSYRFYTGIQGDTLRNCRLLDQSAGDSITLRFETTSQLFGGEGLSVAVSWPKGVVAQPSRLSQANYFFWNNKAVFLLPLATLLAGLVAFARWRRYGRDPEKGPIVTQYDPPNGYSPAAVGYIFDQVYSKKLTAATIVDAAVQGHIKIDVNREGFIFKHNAYHITEGRGQKKPTANRYLDFKDDIRMLIGTTIENGKYNSLLFDLDKTIRKHCETVYKNRDGVARPGNTGFFALNYSYMTLPIVIVVVAVIWSFGWGLIPALNHRGSGLQVVYFALGVILAWTTLKIFSRLMRAYSAEGQKMRDYIEGFRNFLAAADTPRLNTLNPPDRSLELYEKYLPFAIALGCEIQWGHQFEDIIRSASLDPNTSSSFTSGFVTGSSFNSSFASSFSGAIASSSTPPSSSSGGGSFGGGSSGGGGGGGGGGGW